MRSEYSDITFTAMISTSHSLLAASALLVLGAVQILGASSYQDDRDYQYFAQSIQYERDQAETKLNTSRDIFVSNTKTYNIPEFDLIHSNLTACFEEVSESYPTALTDCMVFVNQTVQQTIYDSQQEVEACTNLTHSWELVGALLQGAEDAIASLDTVVNTILVQAQKCVAQYPKSPALKNSCFKNAEGSSKIAFSKATLLAQEAYYQISGGGLLMGAETSSCQKAESFSFEKKCVEITNEVVNSCVPPS